MTFWVGVAVELLGRMIEQGYATRIWGIGGVERWVVSDNGPEQVLGRVGGGGWRLGVDVMAVFILSRSYPREIRLRWERRSVQHRYLGHQLVRWNHDGGCLTMAVVCLTMAAVVRSSRHR